MCLAAQLKTLYHIVQSVLKAVLQRAIFEAQIVMCYSLTQQLVLNLILDRDSLISEVGQGALSYSWFLNLILDRDVCS